MTLDHQKIGKKCPNEKENNGGDTLNYYISDLHLGHANIIKYDDRPFMTTDEQDDIIIVRWNAKVNHNDDVYILGDVSWYDAERTIKIISKLNGQKHLIVGNHDKKLLKNKRFRSLFIEICDYKEIVISNNLGVVLCHYPIPCFNHHFHNWVHLYGHVHNSFEWDMMKEIKKKMEEKYNIPCRMYNVGCMIKYMNYTPRTLEEILKNK